MPIDPAPNMQNVTPVGKEIDTPSDNEANIQNKEIAPESIEQSPVPKEPEIPEEPKAAEPVAKNDTVTDKEVLKALLEEISTLKTAISDLKKQPTGYLNPIQGGAADDGTEITNFDDLYAKMFNSKGDN